MPKLSGLRVSAQLMTEGVWIDYHAGEVVDENDVNDSRLFVKVASTSSMACTRELSELRKQYARKYGVRQRDIPPDELEKLAKIANARTVLRDLRGAEDLPPYTSEVGERIFLDPEYEIFYLRVLGYAGMDDNYSKNRSVQDALGNSAGGSAIGSKPEGSASAASVAKS